MRSHSWGTNAGNMQFWSNKFVIYCNGNITTFNSRTYMSPVKYVMVCYTILPTIFLLVQMLCSFMLSSALISNLAKEDNQDCRNMIYP
uniref:Uncharacterized protein n=1 Tax=Rhizophora mucronata TaxID=61149 RepID=A0A2P2IJE0_RHIMU